MWRSVTLPEMICFVSTPKAYLQLRRVSSEVFKATQKSIQETSISQSVVPVNALILFFCQGNDVSISTDEFQLFTDFSPAIIHELKKYFSRIGRRRAIQQRWTIRNHHQPVYHRYLIILIEIQYRQRDYYHSLPKMITIMNRCEDDWLIVASMKFKRELFTSCLYIHRNDG